MFLFKAYKLKREVRRKPKNYYLTSLAEVEYKIVEFQVLTGISMVDLKTPHSDILKSVSYTRFRMKAQFVAKNDCIFLTYFEKSHVRLMKKQHFSF